MLKSLAFTEIEKIIGFQLPKSAYTHRAWWANPSSPKDHPHAQAWITSGWFVDVVDKKNKIVHFKRKNISKEESSDELPISKQCDNTEQYANEEHFRNWLQKELKKNLNLLNSGFIVLESKNVNDILICKEDDILPLIIFIEVKFYKKSSSRIGFGDGSGYGFQPEILIKKPKYFEKYLRWLIATENAKCIFVENEIIRKYASGKSINEGKQNNIRKSIFDGTIKQFSIEKSPNIIIDWLNIL